MSLPQMLIPTYVQMLGTMSSWLDKAEAEGEAEKAAALPAARLAEDMFPLATQVRFACVQALEGVYRLQEQDFPDAIAALRDEAVAANERPGTMADARARIAETLARIQDLAKNECDIDPASPLVHDLPNGMTFDFSAEQYARDWALPQFYFHVMTTYAILRAQGVPLGKADYCGHLFPYLRGQSQ